MRVDLSRGRRVAVLGLVLLGCLAVSLSGGPAAILALVTAGLTALGRSRARAPGPDALVRRYAFTYGLGPITRRTLLGERSTRSSG